MVTMLLPVLGIYLPPIAAPCPQSHQGLLFLSKHLHHPEGVLGSMSLAIWEPSRVGLTTLSGGKAGKDHMCPQRIRHNDCEGSANRAHIGSEYTWCPQ